ncbi:MAG: hypothetical protein CME88_05725 [Hirschia sp.]|nr:hypothetical protein [Hirschia sp.]MBF17863.1 hypothetical protein [Hirschia sp.]|tara:strand:+ start:81 stop:323 length:243 start_codon:yes stop_codon:yes gene_type:complete
MSHTPHELHDEFPESVARISRMKSQDAHFCRIADDYHALNRQIHRIEVQIEAASDFRMEELRKKRLALKDEIAEMLRQKA